MCVHSHFFMESYGHMEGSVCSEFFSLECDVFGLIAERETSSCVNSSP